jgi:hypothetical protein
MASNGARWTGLAPYDVETTGALGLGVHDAPIYDRCPMSSAAEGNADQQTRPVKQYGQTTGGYRCWSGGRRVHMALKALSYAMIGVFVGGLLMTLFGSASMLLGL